MTRIIQEHPKCIGCGSCVAVCDKFFEMGPDGLAVIKGGQLVGENYELEIDDVGCTREAAEVCPVQIIKVE